ncbi:hypothetical protein CTEN210_12721 [Chaetoceros tenuissimus]|uniref:Uncharacterized protein n=1 Tax=Chaetoceros tenuissimus TaxID=426638 RepID=A0AAD3D496_9STRA|nr:hypothetical protein CTEN210_12721 [Chaetoceros tenuissimus]
MQMSEDSSHHQQHQEDEQFLYHHHDISSSFNFTPTAVVLATTTGSLSCVSSLAIISIIIRSKKQSPYHRIMLIYSFFDFMFSLTVALTTIPMPSKEYEMIYEFGGPSYGNQLTCTLQGFSIMISSFGLFASASLLYTYYCCSIVFKMPKETFATKVERPFIFGSFIILSIYTIIALVNYSDMINPTPLAPWCSWDSYPHGCTSEDIEQDDAIDEEFLICRRGNSKKQDSFGKVFLLPPLTFSFAVLVVTMTLILQNHLKYSRELRKVRDNMDQNEEDHDIQKRVIKEASITLKKVALEAIAYIISFLITWMHLLLQRIFLKSSNEWEDLRALDLIRFIFLPSQGTLHLLIFLWQKVDTIRKNYPDLELSTFEVLRCVICQPYKFEDERPIQNLDMILQVGSKRVIHQSLQSKTNQVHTASEFGFNLYKDIKLPKKCSMALKKHAKNEERLNEKQEESLDDSFLDSCFSLTNIPESIDPEFSVSKSEEKSLGLYSIAEEK